MQYVSTRGDAPKLNMRETITMGLAKDGGLYMPQTFPQFSHKQIKEMNGKTYQEIAMEIIKPFVEGDINETKIKNIINETYKNFSHNAITPLVQMGENEFILELFHGPTLAFKDLAMQLLARLIDHIVKEKGGSVNIIGATSGDTGAAAVEAFGGRSNCKLFTLFPKGKISKVQEKQITNAGYDNTFALAVDGDFDDCQALVKKMFQNEKFRNQYNLLGVNSINWGRIMAQIIYYFVAAVALGAPKRKINFCVPTGNFGDIFAGYCAKKMGLTIDKLIIATNSNDILNRTWESGKYQRKNSMATISPSMDIQVSSNFERLLFEESQRDAQYIQRIMKGLDQKGEFELTDAVHKNIKENFLSGAASEEQTIEAIRKCYEENGYVADPHTAVAIHVARVAKLPAHQPPESNNPCVILATAHPAKFPEAVEKATGVKPKLPENVEQKLQKDAIYENVKNNVREIEEAIVNKQK